ncbi:hypothetical protein PISL3812_06969 [Talaromyces islandicus]|uniref:Uncharacterized protein n=1 Tax=Talaromyces islandicus TaxID=28573 RepID=A0A0U1M4I2_TALIS|nr:hypothetical protein PISL3812_06969 [Talaromyces islandicus]
MGAGKYSQQSLKVEFVDVTPGPRVIIYNQKFSLGLRITDKDTLLSGSRKEVRLFVLFKGVDYVKIQKRCTLRPTPENAESNLILRDMTFDELPPSITTTPDLEIQFKAQIPLPGHKTEEALSDTFRLVQDAEYARMYYDISDSDILNEMNTVHHVESAENNTEKDCKGWKWDFVERDRQLLRWAMK